MTQSMMKTLMTAVAVCVLSGHAQAGSWFSDALPTTSSAVASWTSDQIEVQPDVRGTPFDLAGDGQGSVVIMAESKSFRSGFLDQSAEPAGPWPSLDLVKFVGDGQGGVVAPTVQALSY